MLILPTMRAPRASPAAPQQETTSSGEQVKSCGVQSAQRADEADHPVESTDATLSGEVMLETQQTHLKKMARSTQHLMTHMPKNQHWEFCQRAKVTKSQARWKITEGENAIVFGERVTADHLITGDEVSKGIDNGKSGLSPFGPSHKMG